MLIVDHLLASHLAKLREDRRKKAGDAAEERDVISGGQAYRFPIVASCALLGMFLAYRFLPKEWVSFFLTLYGVAFGGLALANVLCPFVEEMPCVSKAVMTRTFKYKDWFEVTFSDVISTILASPVMVWYYRKRHWLSNNILGASLALSAVDVLALGDFKSGAVLLSGLFIYDIFWVFGSESVFGSNVMVSVAKNFEGPIKLVFPRFVGAGPKDTSMLGLGDIVIPGLFVALMLRFDTRHESKAPAVKTSGYPYFNSAIIAYVSGLVATYTALTVFEAAQPALLYLVPACLGFTLVLSVVKGELGELWSYTEIDEEADKLKADKKAALAKQKESGKVDSAVSAIESKKDQ